MPPGPHTAHDDPIGRFENEGGRVAVAQRCSSVAANDTMPAAFNKMSIAAKPRRTTMHRRTLDRLLSLAGLALAALLIVAGSLLTWAHYFVSDQVHSQLAAQQIYFPAKGSPATAGAAFAPMRQYAGQQLTTGAQAETYADHFIAVHLREIGGGKTYAQLSAQAQVNPTDTKLAAAVDTMFKGETLKGLLNEAYAFSVFGQIAFYATIGLGLAGLVVLGALIFEIIDARRSQDVVAAVEQPVPTAAIR